MSESGVTLWAAVEWGSDGVLMAGGWVGVMVEVGWTVVVAGWLVVVVMVVAVGQGAMVMGECPEAAVTGAWG